MEKTQNAFPNALFRSPSQSSTESSNHESNHTTEPTFSEAGSSFTSLYDQPTTVININHLSIPKSPISHFCIASFRALTPHITCLAVQTPYLYAATTKEINVFDLHSFSLVDTFGRGHGLGWVRSIAFDGRKIFTGHQDCKIRVWQLIKPSAPRNPKHQLISTLPTFKHRLLKSLFAKNYVQIRRHRKKLWCQHADAVSGIAVTRANGLMYSVSWDRSFKAWKLSSGMCCLESVRAHSDAVNAVVFSPADKIVYTGGADGQIKAWKQSDDGKRHDLVASEEKHKSSVNALALTGDGPGVCSGGADRVILLWRWEDCGNRMVVDCALEGHRGAVLCLVNVGRVLISGSSDGAVRMWKCGKGFGECLGVLEGHSRPVKSLVGIFTGEESEGTDLTVVSGSLDGEIRAWKVVISLDG